MSDFYITLISHTVLTAILSDEPGLSFIQFNSRLEAHVDALLTVIGGVEGKFLQVGFPPSRGLLKLLWI